MALSNSLRQPACLGLGVADVNRTLDGGLDGALHLAAENASVELVQTLLERGAMVNAPNGEGAAALHLAARRGNLPVLHKLLSDPAVAIDQLDLSRRSALHHAVRAAASAPVSPSRGFEHPTWVPSPVVGLYQYLRPSGVAASTQGFFEDLQPIAALQS